eukprot:1405338-Pyramimonas_sp.AAC.1
MARRGGFPARRGGFIARRSEFMARRGEFTASLRCDSRMSRRRTLCAAGSRSPGWVDSVLPHLEEGVRVPAG